MKLLARLAGATAITVLSAATATADCGMSSYTCDHDYSVDLSICQDAQPRTGWVTVTRTIGDYVQTLYKDHQLTEEPTAASHPIKRFVGGPLHVELNMTVISPPFDVKVGRRTPDGVNYFATCKFDRG